jgi:hypothetical protein
MNQNHITHLLLAVVLGLSGFSLRETTEHGKILARIVEAKTTSDRDLLELRARVAVAEAAIAETKAKVAVIESRIHP